MMSIPFAPKPLAALVSLFGFAVLAGCASPGSGGSEPASRWAGRSAAADVRETMTEAGNRGAPLAGRSPITLPLPTEAAASATLPPTLVEALKPAAVAKEPRFTVNFVSALPEVAMLAILRDSPLSVAVDPALKTPLAISLKNVTVREALEVMRELHGFEYQLVGRMLVVRPGDMQTRMYRVSYPVFSRSGRSETRVVSGSITGSGGGAGSGSAPAGGASGGGNPASPQGGGGGGSASESSRVTTSQRNDVWADLEQSVRLIVGEKDGRSVVISPQTGTIIVRGMPRDQRAVLQYLESARLSIERQVMIEAKIVEVQLRETVATGINWAAFRNSNQRISAGIVNPGTSLASSGSLATNNLSATPGEVLTGAASTLSGGLLGLVFQSNNFAAVLEFLGTQGQVQVLSSPRIATMNNQKAVLKVGTDDFFVTNISTTTTSTGTTSQTSPTISVQPFFSGIALDVTPHIDDQGYIVLHVHPAVSNVGERNKVLNLGSAGSFSLPLASSEVSETDSVVRAVNGRIIAIGGLMRTESRNGSSGIPGLGNNPLRSMFGGKTDAVIDKRELVMLLKPTIVDPSSDDPAQSQDALARVSEMLRNAPAPEAAPQ